MEEFRPATRAHIAAVVLLEIAAARAMLDVGDESPSAQIREQARANARHATDEIERILSRLKLSQALDEEVRRQLNELKDCLKLTKADVIDLNSRRASAAG